MIKFDREDNGKTGRFIIYENDKPAGEMTYQWLENGKIAIDHTRVGEEFGGKGYAKQLMSEATEFARKTNIKIVPICPFVKTAFEKAPAIQDLRADQGK